ncbi:hypothetical protein LIX17_25285 (plasmid) [Mycobacterium avium subsp. hominissuis]|uniref:Uncharacterized protein n=1 Tax=Mycobacterium kiyosense TaxID=2871094 RepID=A0AA37PZ58_9MYCO|nr:MULTISPECIES: hypothetical protein [Mycobacterium]QWY65275.1 hypothetical protein BJP78_26690 [Mycobacterium avium subsp. hominissuis]GLB87000.1 hypothetical protein SRL2020028_62560 [Mycobacterium kiyosense]
MEYSSYSEAMRAARAAARWAERRGEFLATAMAKKLRIDGADDKTIADALGVSTREAKRLVATPTPVWAVAARQPAIDELRHVQTAVDAVVHAASGLDVDELRDWARIYEGENGISSCGPYIHGDSVNHALRDVAVFSGRLTDPGLSPADLPAVQRKLRLAQARARQFGADDTTIIGHMAA